MMSDKSSCTVRGTLAVVLRLSKMHGVAPLHMKPLGDGSYIIRASKPRFNTWFLLVVIIATILIGLIMDLHLYETPTAIRVKTTSALIVWLGDLGTLMTITFVGVYQGETRMKRILRSLIDIEKIKKVIGHDYKNPKERLFTVGVIALTIYLYIIVVLDFGVYILDAYVNRREKVVVYIYGLVYFGYILTLLLIMQVIFVVLAIHSTFKTINNCLRNLIDLYKFKTKQPTVQNELLIVSNIIRPVNITNTWIPKFDDISARKMIQNLSDSYILLCNVVESFNEENGLLILLLIGSYIGYTFISNYYMIRDLCSPDLINEWKNVSSILIPVVWIVLRFIEFFTLIESFHRTHEEMEEAQVLLSKVIYNTAPVGYTIPPEMETFYKQIVLYKPSFSPLYICTMHRSQIAAIIAGVTTYMVVIIQYHLIEECKA